ncbi:hypothetical protein V8B97DRAFT_2078856 [Scleroderma yunnanense]
MSIQALDMIGTKLPFFTLATRSIATLVRVPFELLKPYTRYPYGLVIPQSLTEHILEQKLASFGVTVRRPCRVIDMKPNLSNAKLADVTFEDGQVITAKYIIAADGARSTICSIAGINFPMSFDDENLDGFPTRGILSPRNYFLCVSFPTRFRTHCAIADIFFTHLPTGDASDSQGPAILLVGDAAHMHSPAGGQGMNLGLRDAIFLREALTKCINAAETQPLSDADIILTSSRTSQYAIHES